MGYVPIAYTDIGRGAVGSGSGWSTLADNHDEVYRLHAPPVLCESVNVTVNTTMRGGAAAAEAYADDLLWRIRDNADLCDVVCWVRVKATTGAGDIRFTVGSDTATIAVDSDTYRWIPITVTPTSSGLQECSIETKVDTGSTDEIHIDGIACHIAHPLPAAGVLTSGYAQSAGQLETSNQPIASEHVERVVNGPRLLAADRPHVLFTHLVYLASSVTARTETLWGTYNTTDWARVGRFMLPAASGSEPRNVTIDWYVSESTSGYAGKLQIGSTVVDFTTTGWNTTTIEVGRDWLMGTVHIAPGASNAVAVRTMQIWRTG